MGEGLACTNTFICRESTILRTCQTWCGWAVSDRFQVSSTETICNLLYGPQTPPGRTWWRLGECDGVWPMSCWWTLQNIHVNIQNDYWLNLNIIKHNNSNSKWNSTIAHKHCTTKSPLIQFVQQPVEWTDNLTQVFVKLCMEIDALCVWSGPLNKGFHLLWSRCWLGLHCSHWENRKKTGGTEHFSFCIHSRALCCAAVHEEASSSSSSYTHN